MTEKLKPHGFAPVRVEAKAGEYAGQEVIFGTDKFRFLSGKLCDKEVSICLSAPDGVSVESISLERKYNNNQDLEDYTLSLMEKITDTYGSPSFCVIKKLLPIDELLKLREEHGNNIPDILASWEQANGSILVQMGYSDKSLFCNFSNSSKEDSNHL